MNLPEEMVAEILSRISIKETLHCRRVCKRWHDILSKPYYANLHLSKSPACLLVLEYTDVLKLGELVDEFDRHDISHDPVMRFDLGLRGPRYGEYRLIGSINGLICIWLFRDNEATCICNPITREYTILPHHKYVRKKYDETSNIRITCGFGFVEATMQYKVVRIYQGIFPFPDGSYKSECEIYTLGTCLWRSLGHVPFEVYRFNESITRQNGIFANGNLHWLAFDVEDNTNQVLCTFDLEKESFQLTTSTPRIGGNSTYNKRTLGILGGCLCLCDSTSDSKCTIWVMKDYGMKGSWSKEIVFIRDESIANFFTWTEMVTAIKVLKDGNILMLFLSDYLFTYHPGNKTLRKLDIFDDGIFEIFEAMVFVPSFISLKSLELEDVSLF